jgi:hypothetical protein
LIACLTGCAATPTVVTKTITVEVPVERIVPVPAPLTVDCAPAALAGTTLQGILDRLTTVEGALADCRDRMTQIRNLK